MGSTWAGHPSAAGDPGGAAAAVVAELWRVACPGPQPLAAEPGAAAVDLAAAIRRVAAEAEQLAVHAPVAERAAARLLTETAQAVQRALGGHAMDGGGTIGEGGTLPSPVRRQLARLERWLATRATADPDAAASADLCLWVLGHLEADAS